MNAARFNRHIADGRARAEGNLAALERAYHLTLTLAARHAADRFEALSTDHLVADATDPKWTPPENDQLLDPDAMAADAQKRTKATHRASLKTVVGPALADVGIAYDVSNPLISGLIDKLGVRAQDMGAAVRGDIASAVLDAYQQGLSVPDTAAAIRAKVEEIAPARATMLARTDLVGLANGASMAAAQIVAGADTGGEGALGFKSWLATEDERTRESHADADGQIVPLDQGFDVGGEQLAYPGDPDGSDEEVCNCRCTVTYLDAAEAAGETGDEGLALAADGGPDVSNLAMVAVYPRPHEASALAIDGGLGPDDLHCTLLFLGDASDLDEQALHAAVAATAKQLPPLEGEIGGAAHFAENPDGYPSILLPDVKSLSTLQETVRANLSAAGITSPSEHGFLPHMTLTYSPDPAVPDPANLGSPLHFDALSVVIAKKKVDYPLTGAIVSAGHMDASPLDTVAAVTVTVGDDSAAQAAPQAPLRWRAILAIEGRETQDNATLTRMLAVGETTWRELPLPLGVMYETPHSEGVNAEVCGLIDTIYRDDTDFRIIWGEGAFNADEVGQRAAEMIGNLSLRGVSIDPYVPEVEIFDTPADTENGVGHSLIVMKNAVIMAATVCPVQAIDGAQITLVASSENPDVMPYFSETCFVLTAASSTQDGGDLDPRVAESLAKLERVARPERFREYKLGMETGIYTLNDCLLSEGRPAVEGGDERAMPMPAKTLTQITDRLTEMARTHEALVAALERAAAHEEHTQALVASIDALTAKVAAGDRVDEAMIETLRALSVRKPLDVIRDEHGRAIAYQPRED